MVEFHFGVSIFCCCFSLHFACSSTQGLECCSRLEEVSLENNCITKLDGLGKLSHLIRLSLAQNYVTSVDGAMLQHLTSLAYLSLENNLMTCLSGLQRLTALMELYMGNNQVASIREAYFLKVGWIIHYINL